MAQQFSGAPYLNSYGVQDRYGYQGEVSPDVAIEEQALNRKQQIANLLVQQGLQGAGSGQMVGRFLVRHPARSTRPRLVRFSRGRLARTPLTPSGKTSRRT